MVALWDKAPPCPSERSSESAFSASSTPSYVFSAFSSTFSTSPRCLAEE